MRKLYILRNYMAEIDFKLLEIDEEDKNIALKFIENGILTEGGILMRYFMWAFYCFL